MNITKVRKQYLQIENWQELDFFRPRGGLSTTDFLTAEIVFDYELVRCGRALAEYIIAFPDRQERALSYLRSLPSLARWSLGLRAGYVPNDLDTLKLEPRIPTVCLITPWFPSPWLYGSLKERRRIVQLLTDSYTHVRPLQLRPYPLDPDYAAMLELAASETFRIWVIGIDEQEPFATTAARLIAARKELGHRPTKRSKRHRTDHGAVAALQRLMCYRLSLMSPAQRREWIEKLPSFSGVKDAESRIFHGAALIRREFDKRNYALVL